MNTFLPTSPQDLAACGWDALDIILISGDAYVDHPSFGTALIGRVLEAAGFRVGIIAQPDLSRDEALLKLGRPKLFFGVSSGNMDSMVNHYTAQRKLRHDDAYSPDGQAGLRPNRAVIIYTNHLKRLFKDVPVVIGGIEASMRRLAHYDYWQDKVRSSILADSKADILVYGMAERALVDIANALRDGMDIGSLKDIPGTAVFAARDADVDATTLLPDDKSCVDKETFHQMSRQFWSQHDIKTLYQVNGGRMIKHNPPAPALSSPELDALYALPFTRQPHPDYQNSTIPAWEQIKHSLTSHRGCYGGCNFCAIAAHQGRRISSRSKASIKAEAKVLVKNSGAKGITITDIGGPTANMYGSYCALGWPDSCRRQSCLFPTICPNLRYNHKEQLQLLEEAGRLEGVNHLFVASGVRHDMALESQEYIRALALRYAGGRLKLAPEHSEAAVLKLMGKPQIGCYEEFSRQFYSLSQQAGIKRQIIPYLIVGHPGSKMESARDMRKWLIKHRIKVDQVQEFTPTPMTISTCMYYTGLDFNTGKPIHVPKPGEVRKQKELVLWHKPSGKRVYKRDFDSFA